MKLKRRPRSKTALRTWIASKSEGINVCTDYDVKGKVAVLDDEFNVNDDSIVAGKSNGVGVVCRDGKK
jgi:hypothetical protein